MSIRVLHGDCRAVLPSLPASSVQCVVTSPPYFGLRDYGIDGQIGLEPSPEEYVAQLVAVFAEVRRVLRDDATVWLNLGDAMQSKQLLGIPWRVAFALQADGWYLRSAIVWAKPNPMPESVTDRPTSSYEHVFLLAKAERYYYDNAAIAEESQGRELFGNSRSKGHCLSRQDNSRRDMSPTTHRNTRNVWTIATTPYSGAHFATMPPELAERCILAGSRPGDTVLDPFAGAGTTCLVADRLQRDAIGIELNPAYTAMARNRVTADCPLFAEVAD